MLSASHMRRKIQKYVMEPTRGKFEIAKFDGKGDFGLWKFMMLAQLEIQGLLSVLEEETPTTSDLGKQVDGDDVMFDKKRSEKDLRVKSLLRHVSQT